MNDFFSENFPLKSINNESYKKGIDIYFKSSEKYYSKIIDLLLKQNYFKHELAVNFNSKPTFYTEIKCLKKEKIIKSESDIFSINEEFKYVFEFYLVYCTMLKNISTNLKTQIFEQNMINAFNNLEIILN
ncbi:MAG: hypothetical protein PHN56_03010 [Candidatus Nanoarchaeia archaeon]|nr:hypothetical protein [Candidatus Nanoarchaeia archaeon]